MDNACCKYKPICKHYRKDSFTCNADLTDKERSYCGAFRQFVDNKSIHEQEQQHE